MPRPALPKARERETVPGALLYSSPAPREAVRTAADAPLTLAVWHGAVRTRDNAAQTQMSTSGFETGLEEARKNSILDSLVAVPIWSEVAQLRCGLRWPLRQGAVEVVAGPWLRKRPKIRGRLRYSRQMGTEDGAKPIVRRTRERIRQVAGYRSGLVHRGRFRTTVLRDRPPAHAT
jgi:hypothetical protein